MRLREGSPPPIDPEEVETLVDTVDRSLIMSVANQPRATWIGHATVLVQYRGINFFNRPAPDAKAFCI